MTWETIIGLEVHVQLKTRSKLFSPASTAYGQAPNSQACGIDLGLPGTLPVLNEEAVNMAIALGLAVGATIDKASVFARKNYFYPDLPKGYQISQDKRPIVCGGSLTIEDAQGQPKVIDITRAHLEEDAGKSLHDLFSGISAVDLNRAGTPLLEIVSEPQMRSAQEAVAYLKKLHALVMCLGICDGNMQEGSFRVDANVSVRKLGSTVLGTRCEIKNVNSFKFVEKAILYEAQRQIDCIENGIPIVQQTRLYDSVKNETRAMRDKENAHDYRYFPCPDLLPVVIEQAHIDAIAQSLPELPDQKKARFMETLGLSAYDADVLTSDMGLAHFFEEVVRLVPHADAAKVVANWVLGDFLGALNKHGLEIAQSPIRAQALSMLVARILDNTISGKIAKSIFEALWQGETDDVDAYIDAQGLRQVTDTGAIEEAIRTVLQANPEQVQAYREGKDRLFGFFVGQIMKATQGKANPEQVNMLLKKLLSED